MDGLRWLLLLFGLVVVIGVYFYSRKDRENTKETPLSPDLDESQPDMERRAPSFGNEPAEPAESDDESPQPDQRIITLRIVAGDSGAFSGENLILSLRGIGMRHGKFGIFHQYDGTDESKIVFSAASLVEPGSFDLENIREQQISGISLFMVLPSVIEGTQAFDLMMTAARTLSKSLAAKLLDESGSTLSIQRERYLREEIIQHEHGFDVT